MNKILKFISGISSKVYITIIWIVVVGVITTGVYMKYTSMAEEINELRNRLSVVTFDCNQSRKVEQLEIELMGIELKELENKGLVDAILSDNNGTYIIGV